MQEAFPFNIRHLQAIHQAISSNQLQVTHSEQILAGSAGPGKFQAGASTWP
jgi:hypothetical protein